jgi:hypothetical protein
VRRPSLVQTKSTNGGRRVVNDSIIEQPDWG